MSFNSASNHIRVVQYDFVYHSSIWLQTSPITIIKFTSHFKFISNNTAVNKMKVKRIELRSGQPLTRELNWRILLCSSNSYCPSHSEHKATYLPAIPFLFDMMKDVYYITDSSWKFLDFCSKKDTCHSTDLKYNIIKMGRFGVNFAEWLITFAV